MVDIAAVQALVDERVPLIKHMGIKITDFNEEGVTSFMPFMPSNLNHVGTIYAGALFSHAEVTAGVTLLFRFQIGEYFLVIRHMEIDYTAPATADVTGKAKLDEALLAQVEADLQEKGKSVRKFPVRLFCEGEQIAEAQVTFYLRRNEQ